MQSIDALRDVFVSVIRSERRRTNLDMPGENGLSLYKTISIIAADYGYDNEELVRGLNCLFEEQTLICIVRANWTWTGRPHGGNRYGSWRVWYLPTSMDFFRVDNAGRYVFDISGNQSQAPREVYSSIDDQTPIYWQTASLFVEADGLGSHTRSVVFKRPHTQDDMDNQVRMLTPPWEW